MVEHGQGYKRSQDVENQIHPKYVNGDVHRIDPELGGLQDVCHIKPLILGKCQVFQIRAVK